MREVEKSKSVLYKTRVSGQMVPESSGMNGGYGGSVPPETRGKSTLAEDEASGVIEQQLDPEQLQLFAQENQDMLKQYEDQLDKVRYVMAMSKMNVIDVNQI